MTLKLAAAAGIIALGMATTAATAAPVSMAKDAVVAPTAAVAPVELVHFNHRSCQLGRRGWHYHRFGDREWCRPFRRRY